MTLTEGNVKNRKRKDTNLRPTSPPPTPTKTISYKKYEFCKSVNCSCLKSDDMKIESCICFFEEDCLYTAKKFHKWLKLNNFKIVKEYFK